MSLKRNLSAGWKGLLHFFRQLLHRLPIAWKVTLWYTLFLTLILVLFTGTVLKLAEDRERRMSGKVLLEAVEKASQKDRPFTGYDKSVYLTLRSSDGKILQGFEPDGMPQLPPAFGKGPQKVQFGGQSYHYVDMPRHHMKEMEKTPGGLPRRGPGPWVRGVLPDQVFAHRYQVFLFSALLLLPLFVILVAAGGYKIIKHSFAPVQAMSKAARAIGETGDLSQRLPLGEGSDEIHQMGRTFNWMLEQLEGQLEREKRFTSDVSHELRTPTAVIMAESELNKDYTDSVEEAREGFAHIFDQSRHMAYLINELLELSRLGSKKTVDFRPVNWSELVRGTAEDYKKLPQAQNLHWDIQIAPNITVLGEEPLLHRVLGNYLDNALKFTKTKIAVSLAEKNGQAVLSVTDDGRGIPKERQQEIWDRLVQVDPSRNKRKNQGLGLGLSFVYAASKLLKGKASVESTLEKGSTFIFSLPLKKK